MLGHFEGQRPWAPIEDVVNKQSGVLVGKTVVCVCVCVCACVCIHCGELLTQALVFIKPGHTLGYCADQWVSSSDPTSIPDIGGGRGGAEHPQRKAVFNNSRHVNFQVLVNHDRNI